MTSTFKKMTCRALVVSLLTLSFTTARAGFISPDQAAQQAAQTDRAVVMSVLDRSETATQLAQLGIDPQTARARVNAMTDQEVHALAQDIQTAPAGAMSGWGWAAVILIAAAIWYFAYRR
ncbi:PA2779 family protein [Ramlibacter sp. PS4R-6]|uniref:PA2779 family protein n=1 Tax=Ramlibacter sp. PS4R-6 TaxID=3133438 RepID=UPI0030A2C1B4